MRTAIQTEDGWLNTLRNTYVKWNPQNTLEWIKSVRKKGKQGFSWNLGNRVRRGGGCRRGVNPWETWGQATDMLSSHLTNKLMRLLYLPILHVRKKEVASLT